MPLGTSVQHETDSMPPSWFRDRVPAWIILPIRLFLGISFLAAGFDKLTDPTYLDPAASQYIGHQIAGFAPGTPLEGFLLNFALPNASLFGVLTMGGELCIGIAVLLGLLTRFSAAMGLLLNFTFFLSATWDVRPFYFGADLPYIFCWLTLLLAGPGPFALDSVVRRWLAVPAPVQNAGMLAGESSSVLTRRAFLGAGAVGLTGVMMAATGLGWSALHATRAGAVAQLSPSPQPTPPQAPTAMPDIPVASPAGDQPTATVAPQQPTPEPSLTAPTPTPAPEQPQATQPQATQPQATQPPTEAPTAWVTGRQLIAGPGDVALNDALEFTLPTGEPAVLVHNDAGYSAYVAICTHEGCTVSYNASRKVLRCPCHSAQFDPGNNGQVLRGPARRPLSAVAVTVGPDGSVYLA